MNKKNVIIGLLVATLVIVIGVIVVAKTKLDDADLRANDSMIKFNVNQAKAQAEILRFDDGSYIKLCSDDTLNENAGDDYGDKLRSLEEDIAEVQGGFLNMHCQANDNNYCISAELNTSLGLYFCVDNSGFVKTDANGDMCSSTSINCR